MVSTLCTRSHIATTKQKIKISKIRKNCPLKSFYVAPRENVCCNHPKIQKREVFPLRNSAEEIRCVFDDNSKIIFVKSS